MNALVTERARIVAKPDPGPCPVIETKRLILRPHRLGGVAGELHVQRQTIPTKRIEALLCAARVGDSAEITRTTIVIKDDLLVEIAKLGHQRNTSRTRLSPAARTSISSGVAPICTVRRRASRARACAWAACTAASKACINATHTATSMTPPPRQ